MPGRGEDRCPPSASVRPSIPFPEEQSSLLLLRPPLHIYCEFKCAGAADCRRCRVSPGEISACCRCLSVCPISGTYSARLTQSLPPRGRSRPTDGGGGGAAVGALGISLGAAALQRRRILSPDGSCRRAAPSVRCGVYTQMATVAARLLIFLFFQGSLRKRTSMRD